MSCFCVVPKLSLDGKSGTVYEQLMRHPELLCKPQRQCLGLHDSALHLASEAKNLEAIKQVFQFLAAADMASLQTSLLAYCRRADLQLPTNADEAARIAANITNNKGQTPLMYACYADCPEAVRELLQHGADPWVADRCGCRNALHYASMAGSPGCIEVLMKVPLSTQLLRQGVRYVNSRSLSGLTPLHYAVFYERQTAAEELLRHEPNINAASTGESYDVWVTYDTLSTPLHFAAYRDSTQVARLLLVHYARYRRTGTILDPRQRSNSAGKQPWQVTRSRALAAMLHPVMPLREVLGADVLERLEGPEGLGPLSLAAIAGAALRQKLLHSVEVIEKECVEVEAMDRQQSTRRGTTLLCGTPRRNATTTTVPLAVCGSVQRDMFRLASYRLNRPSGTSPALPAAPRRAPTLDRLDGPLPHPPEGDEGFLDLQSHIQHAQSVGHSLYRVGSRGGGYGSPRGGGAAGAVGRTSNSSALAGRRSRKMLAAGRSRGPGGGGTGGGAVPGAGAVGATTAGGGAAASAAPPGGNTWHPGGGGSWYTDGTGGSVGYPVGGTAYPAAGGCYPDRTGPAPAGGSPLGKRLSGGGPAGAPAAMDGLALQTALSRNRSGFVEVPGGSSPPGSHWGYRPAGGSPQRSTAGGTTTPPQRPTAPLPALGAPTGDPSAPAVGPPAGGSTSGGGGVVAGGSSSLLGGDSAGAIGTPAGDSPRSASPGPKGPGPMGMGTGQWPFLGAPAPRQTPPPAMSMAGGSGATPFVEGASGTPFATLAYQPQYFPHAAGGSAVLSPAASLVAGSVAFVGEIEGPEGDSGGINAAAASALGGIGGGSGAAAARGVYDGDDDDENTCNVCFARPEAVASAVCRHGLCAMCAGELCRAVVNKPLLCPFCRQPVRDFVRALPLPPRRVWGAARDASAG